METKQLYWHHIEQLKIDEGRVRCVVADKQHTATVILTPIGDEFEVINNDDGSVFAAGKLGTSAFEDACNNTILGSPSAKFTCTWE